MVMEFLISFKYLEERTKRLIEIHAIAEIRLKYFVIIPQT